MYIEVDEQTRQPMKIDLIATAFHNMRLLFILGCVGAVLAVAVGASMEKQFVASAQILVDPRDLSILDEQVTPNTDADSLSGAVVESQALLFTSRVVLNKVIDKLKLDENPDYNGEGGGGLLSAFAALTASAPTPEEVAETLAARRSAAEEKLQKSIVVKRLAPSFVLEIGAKTNSRQMAQAIVQTVVSSYLQDLLRSRAEIAQRASEDITAGMGALRNRVHAIEREMASYVAQYDLFETRGELMLNFNLAQLTEQLVSAQVETARFKAQLEQAEEDLESLGSLPEALDSVAISNLRAAQAAIAAERAEQEASFSANTAKVRALQDQESAIEQLIRTELIRIRQGLSIAHNRALQHEQDLERKVTEMRREIENASLAQIQLRELERELEAYRTIYNNSLERARVTREQARVNTANVRVISPATASKERVFPPSMPLLAGFGFVAFAMGGFFVLHLKNLARAQLL